MINGIQKFKGILQKTQKEYVCVQAGFMIFGVDVCCLFLLFFLDSR